MAKSESKRIFLVSVSDQVSWFKQNLILELESNGHTVGLSEDLPGNHSKVPELLQDYDLVVHLLSDTDNELTSSGKGIEEQLILYSLQHFKNNSLLVNSPEEQFRIYAWHAKSHVENIYVAESLPSHLKRIQQLEEVELLRTNFEEFKSYLLSRLKKHIIKSSDTQYIKGAENQSIYFLYDISDTPDAKKYVDYLRRRGYVVYTPRFEGDIMSVRNDHNNNLRKFDLAIIFANSAGLTWINMKIMDIIKASGLGRDKEITGKALFMSAQKVEMCPMFHRGFDFIEFHDGIGEEAIESFLQKYQN